MNEDRTLGSGGGDLRNRLGVNGWADVLTLGLDAGVLRQMNPTRHTHTIDGIRFQKHAPHEETVPLSDVWWSDEHALPGAFRISHGAGFTRVTLEQIRAGAGANLLKAPSVRFPAYRSIDLAEWLEGR